MSGYSSDGKQEWSRGLDMAVSIPSARMCWVCMHSLGKRPGRRNPACGMWAWSLWACAQSSCGYLETWLVPNERGWIWHLALRLALLLVILKCKQILRYSIFKCPKVQDCKTEILPLFSNFRREDTLPSWYYSMAKIKKDLSKYYWTMLCEDGLQLQLYSGFCTWTGVWGLTGKLNNKVNGANIAPLI